jgi:putative redox protein
VAEVVVRSLGGLAHRIEARGHELLADEPVEAGGADSGPTPYELLLGALGACTAMTVRLYAQRKGWPLEGVEVALSHDRIHAADCRDWETCEGSLDRITKRLTLRGPLDEAQRQRLAEIAQRCPVHRTLTGKVQIEQLLDQPPASGT